jgi:WD repeat-containing protein 42A
MIVEDQLESILADNVMNEPDDQSQEDDTDSDTEDDEEDEDEDDRLFAPEDADSHQAVPVVYPRTRFTGHCNIETVKDGAI